MKNEKQQKARADARPKKVIEIAGTEIWQDERNWITKKGNFTYYFSTFENALFDIAQELEKSLIKENLLDTVKTLKKSKEDFIKVLSKAIQTK